MTTLGPGSGRLSGALWRAGGASPTSAEVRWYRGRDYRQALAEIARLVERVERGYPSAPGGVELDLLALLEGGPEAVGRRSRSLIVASRPDREADC